MPSHFSCIGLPLANPRELQHLLERLDPLMVVEAQQGQVKHGRWTVFSSAPRDDAECAHCGGADVDIFDSGEMVTRSTVQWLHYRPYRDWLKARRSYELEVAAFSERMTIFPDEAAFSAGRYFESSSLNLAPNAFLPVGMFGEGSNLGQAATVTMAGKIVRAGLLENTFGGPFWRLRLETLPGCIDVLAAADAVAGGAPIGAVALVNAWIVGRPVEWPQVQ